MDVTIFPGPVVLISTYSVLLYIHHNKLASAYPYYVELFASHAGTQI